MSGVAGGGPRDDAHSGDLRILDAWARNAQPWTAAVRARRIPSRVRVTDRAVVDAILERRPATALDLGCGEGWLARALADHGVAVTGVDAVPALVEEARRAGGGTFHVARYDEVAAAGLGRRAEVVVCNFSLLGDRSVESVFRSVPALLAPGGAFFVQTLHPLVACGSGPYADGWRAGTWAGCGDGFGTPAPWYFRTLAGWLHLFREHGLRLADLREPLDAETGWPASVIFVAEAAR